MAATLAQFNSWHRSNPGVLVRVGMALLIGGAAAWVGWQARTATNLLNLKRQAWASAAGQIATVRQQFQVPSAQEAAAVIAESAQSGSLGVPNGERLTLVDAVGRLAEACGLANVRVTPTKGTDSVYVPARMIGSKALPAADYVIDLRANGSFAGLVQLVSTLPPSVTVSRLRAFRQGQTAAYELLLSVYRLDVEQAR